MKLVRWQGLIAFVVVLIVVMGVWFLVVDSVIEAVIEKTGTYIVGAKVELQAADLSISPFGISLTGLEVTNPDAPMTNAVQVDRMALSVEGAKLFRRKVIVKEMTLAGVRLNTPRKTSGAISRRPSAVPAVSKRTAYDKFTLPALAIPNVNEILQREKLQSLELVKSLQADLQAEKEQWQKRLAELPDKAKLAQYKERIDKVQSAKKGGLAGMLGGAKEVVAVQKEIRGDLDLIKTASNKLEKNLASFRKRINEAAEAPQADVNRLKEKYTLSPEGLTNMSRLVFGGKVSKWADTALDWYERLRPVLERVKERKKGSEVVKPVRGKGANVRFKEYEPLPDFLIRTARVSMEIPAGSIEGQIRNITPDQDVLGIPLTYNFSGENLKGLQSVKLNGALNHVNPSSPIDTANLDVSGYQAGDLSLSDSPQFPIALKKASADFNANAVLSDQTLKANLLADLKSVEISTGAKKDDSPLAKAMASSLSDVKRFYVKADISGTLKDYNMRLSSDLDRVLKDAVGKQVKTQAARLEKELKAGISEKVNGPLGDLRADLGGLDAVGSELTSRLNLGSDLLKGTEKKGSEGLKLPGGLPQLP
jgi:uncharacterized protein (TIGR03545 family)